jgi:hypothetical protein
MPMGSLSEASRRPCSNYSSLSSPLHSQEVALGCGRRRVEGGDETDRWIWAGRTSLCQPSLSLLRLLRGGPSCVAWRRDEEEEGRREAARDLEGDDGCRLVSL